jgi:hypothetical protein
MIVRPFRIGQVLRPAILSLDFIIVLPLPNHIILKPIPLLPGVVERRFLRLVVEVGQQSIEVFVDLLLLILNLLVLGLTLPATELSALLVL